MPLESTPRQNTGEMRMGDHCHRLPEGSQPRKLGVLNHFLIILTVMASTVAGLYFALNKISKELTDNGQLPKKDSDSWDLENARASVDQAVSNLSRLESDAKNMSDEELLVEYELIAASLERVTRSMISSSGNESTKLTGSAVSGYTNVMIAMTASEMAKKYDDGTHANQPDDSIMDLVSQPEDPRIISVIKSINAAEKAIADAKKKNNDAEFNYREGTGGKYPQTQMYTAEEQRIEYIKDMRQARMHYMSAISVLDSAIANNNVASEDNAQTKADASELRQAIAGRLAEMYGNMARRANFKALLLYKSAACLSDAIDANKIVANRYGTVVKDAARGFVGVSTRDLSNEPILNADMETPKGNFFEPLSFLQMQCRRQEAIDAMANGDYAAAKGKIEDAMYYYDLATAENPHNPLVIKFGEDLSRISEQIPHIDNGSSASLGNDSALKR